MLPLSCLSLILLIVSPVVIRCDDEATTETLIEMKGDKLDVEETTETAETTETENEATETLIEMISDKLNVEDFTETTETENETTEKVVADEDG